MSDHYEHQDAITGTRAILSPRQDLTEMEVLAWASLPQAEMVERLANEVWKRPLLIRDGEPKDDTGYGRAGVTPSKIKRLVDKFAKGWSVQDRKQLGVEVYVRATQVFDYHIGSWGEVVLYNLHHRRWKTSWPPSVADIDIEITRRVPRGARKQVMACVREALLM